MEEEKNKPKEKQQEIKATPIEQIISFPVETEAIIDMKKELERIEKDIEKYKKIALVAIKQTNESDWIIHGEDQPYLMERGSRRIANSFGVHISYFGRPEMEWHDDDAGRYFVFVAWGRAFCRTLGIYIEEIGTSSQRDKFFGMVSGVYRPLEDVDINDIRKKAVTNLDNRIIKRVTGLLNVTIDDLKQAGLNIEKIKRVKYKEGKQKVEKTLSKSALEKKKEINVIATQIGGGKEDDMKIAIKQASYFKVKDEKGEKEIFAETIDQLTTEGWINTTHKNIISNFKKLYPEEPLPVKEGNQNGK